MWGRMLENQHVIPREREVVSFEQFEEFVMENGFPVVMKPTSETRGGQGITFVTDESFGLQRLRTFFKAHLTND